MRKSCISLVLSGVLMGVCAEDPSTSSQIIANFGDKPKTGKTEGGTYNSAKKNGESASYGTDWTGSSSGLYVKTDGLTFTFGKSSATSLLFKDGFTFSNNLPANSGTQSKANITIKNDSSGAKNGNLSLIFGENGGSDTRVAIGKNLNITLDGFQEVKVQGNLWIGENSNLSVKSSNNGLGKMTNSGGLVLERQASLQAGTLDNQGTLVMSDGSHIQVQSIKSGGGHSKFDIQGNARIEFVANGGSLITNQVATASSTIKGQNFHLWSGKTLTITNTTSVNGQSEVRNGPTTLSLGDSGKAQTSFIGSSGSEVKIEGFSTLESKNLSLSSVIFRSDSIKEIKNSHLTLSNTYILLDKKSEATLQNDTGVKIVSISSSSNTDASPSVFELKGRNNLISAGDQDLKIQGTHSFQGGGSLDILAKSITLGSDNTGSNGITITAAGGAAQSNGVLTLSGQNGTILALGGDAIISQNLKVLDLHFQFLGEKESTLQNKTLELSGQSILEAVNRNDQLVNLKITKNGTSGRNNGSTIKVTKGGNVTLRGKNISITDQTISLENGATGVAGVTVADAKTTLTFEAMEGSVTLGGSSNDSSSPFKIEGKNSDVSKNSIDFKTSQINFGNKVELNKLQIVAGNDDGATFYGTQGGEISFKNGTTITTGRDHNGKTIYKELTFSTQFAQSDQNKQSTLKLSGDTTLKASSITMQNQKVELGNGASTQQVGTGASTGSTLSLYAYGTGEIDSSGEVKGAGTFAFVNTTFAPSSANSATESSVNSSTTQATLKLYGGSSQANREGQVEGGVVLLANDLTLENIKLQALKIPKNSTQTLQTEEKNSLDLSASSGKLTALGTVTIEANGVYTTRAQKDEKGKEVSTRVQGIGMDLHVGNGTKSGKLTIKSDQKSDEFVIGGNLVIDNSQATTQNSLTRQETKSTFEIELGKASSSAGGGGGGGGYSAEANATQAKLSDQTLKLVIDGGITAIGHDSGKSKTGGTTTATTTEIKAKSFEFGATSNLASINGTLKLNTKDDTELEIKGTTVLKGTNTAEAKIEVTKTNGASTGSVSSSPASTNLSVKLKLHDIQSEGKGSITNSGLAFVNSNITAKGVGEAKTLTLIDETIALVELEPSTPVSSQASPQTREVKNQMEGTIASITLDHADLEFKRKTGAEKTPANNGNDASTASIKLNAGSFIKATGNSSLKVKSLYVGEKNDDRFSLEVKDGTFILKEETTQNQIGDITLNAGHFVFEKTGAQAAQKTESKAYHDLKLQGNLTSEGDSSVKVNQIISTQKPDAEVKNYMISSKGGELRFNLQTKEGQTLQNDFTLDHGGISFYDANSQLMDRIVLKDSSITASGDSSIKAKEIDFSGAKISASGGTLKIEGIKTNTHVGDVSVGDSGVLDVRKGVDSLATLKIKEGSRVTLSAHAPYLSPSEPLGGGKFGKIVVDKLIFEGTSGENKLINIAITTQERSIAKAKDDSLFALREGVVTLIDTKNGIEKKVGNAKYDNITLQDISIDKGGYTSVTLTPELIKGKTLLGEEIIKQLNLGIHVSQKTVPELMESIKDPKNKQIMEQIFKDPLNVAIVESILQSQENVFKVGMAEYISSGNVEIVDTTLRYMREAFQGATEGIYASDRIARELKMLRDSNLENRMVRSGNPYVSKTEIASLLDSIKGVRYASDDDGILLDGYSGPNYGSLWASYEGATSFGALENASVNGLSAGYDTLVGDQKEYLLGFYANYGYGTYGSSFVKNNSHNFGLGFYTRMTFDRNEVDLVISQNIGLNHSDLNLGASQALSVQYLNQTLKYNFYITDAQVRYGYLIPVGDKESPFYFKPFGGIDFGFNVNGEMRGDGVAPIGIDQALHFKLNVAVGLEMKKYFNEGSYIYLLPILEKGLFNDGNVINLGFIGANKIPYAQFYQVDTSLGLYAGGQGSVGNNVSITGGLGVKMDVESKDVLTNWNIGFKYKF